MVKNALLAQNTSPRKYARPSLLHPLLRPFHEPNAPH